MRLLILTGELPEMIGGVADHSASLAAKLSALGHEVEVLTSNDPRVVSSRTFGVRTAVSQWKGAQLAQLCLEHRPEVVMFQHSPYLYQRHGMPLGLLHSLATLRRRVPLVLVAHELFIPWGGLRLSPLWLGQRLVAALALRVADVVVVSTERRYGQLRRAGLSELRLKLVRIGPSLPEPGAAESGDALGAPGPFRVGMFTSLDLHWRRPDLVVEAVRRMGARRPDAPVALTLMGRLPQNTARYLEAVPARGDGYDVEATGLLPAPEVARRLQACQAAVLLDTSGLGGISGRSTSVASALALERPLVANRGPETDSIFQDGVNVLFSALSVEAVQAALERLRDDGALRRRLASGAADLHRRHFSWDVVAAAFDELCRAVRWSAAPPTEGAPVR